MLQSMVGSEGRERESMIGVGKTVCVTGASGFIASWLVKFLLLRGYTVKASVRDPSDQKKIEHLLALDGAKEKLHLFKADLLEEGSFDLLVDGCEGVFHTASPCSMDLKDKDPQAEMIEPAVKGTLNVLASCAKTPCVRRVILTSSIAATVYTGQPRTQDMVLDETWYSKPEICKEMKLWYQLAKTLAEDAAWKFVKEKGIDMISINPAMVIGPSLQPALSLSAGIILNFINGSKTFPNFSMGWVNVKDVVNAHIQAFEIPSASGRYVLAERVLHYSEIVEILHKHFPALQLPQRCANDKPFMPTYQISQTKAKTLGVDFIPMEESIREIVESLKEQGFLNF